MSYGEYSRFPLPRAGCKDFGSGFIIRLLVIKSYIFQRGHLVVYIFTNDTPWVIKYFFMGWADELKIDEGYNFNSKRLKYFISSIATTN